MTYTCIETTESTVTFEVTFAMFRDEFGLGANFDNPANIGVFKGKELDWNHELTLNVELMGVSSVNSQVSGDCTSIPSRAKIQKGTYVFEITLDKSETENYMIAFQRCCRPPNLISVETPNEIGTALTIEITPFAQQECDNSPTFNELPPFALCVATPFEHDMSATDIDGDEIVYSFCNPKAAGGTDGIQFGDSRACTGITPAPEDCLPIFDDVHFNAPYSFDRPIGNDSISFNEDTGLFAGLPTQTEMFLAGLCATSYRNGQKICEIRREFNFYVISDLVSNKNIAESVFTLFPNPASNMVYVENVSKSNNITVEIHSIDGERVYSTSTNDSSLEIDVSRFANGLYVLSMKSDEYFSAKKFLVN